MEELLWKFPDKLLNEPLEPFRRQPSSQAVPTSSSKTSLAVFLWSRIKKGMLPRGAVSLLVDYYGMLKRGTVTVLHQVRRLILDAATLLSGGGRIRRRVVRFERRMIPSPELWGGVRNNG
jgi:hypothetical protein